MASAVISTYTQDDHTLSRRASSVLSLGSNPSLASTTSLIMDAEDEPPPYSAVPEPQHTSGPVNAPAWYNNDPRASSQESLLPQQSPDGVTRRSLLLLYLNSSPLSASSASLESFPAHVHNLVSLLLQDTHAVHTKIFPRIASSEGIDTAIADVSEWLTPRDEAKTDIILLGSTLGGLVCAELAILATPDPRRASPFAHTIVGTITFDAPHLGFHPHVSRVSHSHAAHIRSPLASSQASTDGTSQSGVPHHPTAAPHVVAPSSSLENIVQDLESLKHRYCRVRLLEETEGASRSSMTNDRRATPRVRFASYHTACLVASQRDAPRQPTHPVAASTHINGHALTRPQSFSSISTRDTELPPYIQEIDDFDDEEEDFSDVESDFSFDDFEDLGNLDDLDDPLQITDDVTDGDSTLVAEETAAQRQTSALEAPKLPSPPPVPPMPAEFPDRISFKNAMKTWHEELKTYHTNLRTYHSALRAWKKAERSRIRTERRAGRAAHRTNLGKQRCPFNDNPGLSPSDGVGDYYKADLRQQAPDDPQDDTRTQLKEARRRAYEEHAEAYKLACKAERRERRRMTIDASRQLKDRLGAIKVEWKQMESRAKEERKLRHDREKEERKMRQSRDKESRCLKQDLDREGRSMRLDREKEALKLRQDQEKEERKIKQDLEKEARKAKQDVEKEARKAKQDIDKDERKASRASGKLQLLAAKRDARLQKKFGKQRATPDEHASQPDTTTPNPSLNDTALPTRPRTEILFDGEGDVASTTTTTPPIDQASSASTLSFVPHFPLDIKSASPVPPPSNHTPAPAAPAPKMRSMCLLPPKDSVTSARDPCWIQIVIPNAKDEIDAHEQLFCPSPAGVANGGSGTWDPRYGGLVSDVAGRIEMWVRESVGGERGEGRASELPA